MSAWTIIRLAQTHDCPAFWIRPVTAAWAAASRSAEGMTMNGSEPPSSSTTFLSARPAASATLMPAPSLPVRVTATMRSSSISGATRRDGIPRFANSPSGAPAAVTISSIACAQPWVSEACFRRPTLPARMQGARKRTTCQ